VFLVILFTSFSGSLVSRIPGAIHVGELDDISHTIWGIIRHWLPASGEKMRKAPILFHYTNLAEGMTERRLETDIYVPLA
ncbi:GyrI-like domain-containing protein, partial [Escherichia coli]|uniref:GyrI-like domain-containing protein n=1 Tax=Escherichia coli TaxID=562 RepID=UPI0020234024